MSNARTIADKGHIVGRKNLIINGSHQVSQRGVYTSATSLSTAWTYYIDRSKTRINGISGTLTHKLDQSVNSGIVNTVLLTATSSTSGYINSLQNIEDIQVLKTKVLTVSAWVKSNNSNARLVTNIGDGGGVASSPTHTGGGAWELIKFNVTPTSGTTAFGVYIGILASGTGNVTITSGDYCEFTMLQIETGSVATDFEHRSYGEELALCQRYYYQDTSSSYRAVVLDGTGNYPMVFITYPVPMRATPTGSFLSNSTLYYNTGSGSANFVPNASTITQYGDNMGGNIRYNNISNSAGSSNAHKLGMWYLKLAFDAEL